MNFEPTAARLQRALTLHMQGQIAPAVALYESVVSENPSHPDALQLLGMALTQKGDPERGAACIKRSLRINPAQPVARANLGHAQLAMKQYTAALESYDRSIASLPDYAPAHNGRGSALSELGRAAEGLESFDRALRLLPNFPEALGNRGSALFKLRRYEEAVAAFNEVLCVRPDDAPALAHRALAFVHLWRYTEALTDSDRALQIRPSNAHALNARCAALVGLGRFDDVIAATDGVPASREQDSELLFVRANALRQVGRTAEAIAGYERALRVRPDFPEALAALGMLETAERRYDRAAEVFTRLLAAAPEGDFNQGICLHAKLHIFDWSDCASAVGKIVADLDAGKKSDLPFTFLSISDDPERQLRCARAYASARPRTGDSLYHRSMKPHDRIRVAYISADFLEHPMAYLLAGLFETHDRGRFEIIAISLRSDPASPTAKRLRGAFDRFIDASKATDEQIARLLSELEVDIAVDLMGYTSEERPGILVRRPAPIQVNYIGFPATMGSPHIDYILADRFVIPPGEAASYSECVAWLPECFQVNDGRRIRATGEVTRADVGLPPDGFVFGAFHASVKINPPMFDVWARLLKAVPESVLWLISQTPTAETNLRREARQRGVDPARLVFAKRESYPLHLARLGLADLCLDTWPFNGGATTSDALWSGVPMVTMTGRALASRMSGSLLRTIGLTELVTKSFPEYERTACQLAMNRDELLAVRARLARGVVESPLFNTDRCRRYIEAAYTTMWERHRRGEKPEPFLVPASSIADPTMLPAPGSE